MSRLRYLEVDPAEAVSFLAFMVGWGGGDLPVFVDGRPLPAFSLPCGPGVGGELWRRAHALEERRSVQVEVGLPLTNGSVGGSTVLWAWSRSRDSTARAARFRPAPSMVLRFGGGSDRLLLWMLRERVAWPLVGPHNERISYALHAPRTHCLPEKLRVPLPGTFLRVGRARPAPVLVTRMELTEYSRSQVTANLREAPSRDAWRERKSA